MLLALSNPPHPLSHPLGTWLEQHIDWWLFLIVHIVLFVIGTYLAVRALQEGRTTFGTGFALFAVAEIVYMTYHVNLTVFLLAHTIAEVLDGLGFILVFAGAVKEGIVGAVARPREHVLGH
ncbi:MAG TPA: hypothetical protein VL337_09075 [Acidimicrobiales bacterium]|jgi:hypothetical protein|nr:hypothetical protein [Acidimicrobiales bacterium]